MYFDTHAHYDNPKFDADRESVIAGLPEVGVSLAMNVGCDMASSRASVAFAEQYAHIYAAVGVHPHDSREMRDEDLECLKALTKHPKVVAVGEMGLDYHYDYSPRDIQKKRFQDQMELARSVALPAIVHMREAAKDAVEILQQYPDVPGVIHCYSGSLETAKQILDLGWYLSFTGSITYKNASKSHEVIKYMPKDRLMIETDAPYMAPVPHRGKRNGSEYLPFIAETVANLLGITQEDAAALTKENGKRFFRIG